MSGRLGHRGLFLAGGTASSSALYDAIMADSPSAFWWMNEASGTTLTDSSGNAVNGTYDTSGGCAIGQTPILNGVVCALGSGALDHYFATVNDNAAFTFAGNDFAIVCAMKVPSGALDRSVVVKERVGADYPEFGLTVNTGGLLRFGISSSNGSGGYVEASSAGRVDDNTARLIIVEKVGTSINVYSNNTSIVSLSFSGSVWDSTNMLGIGCSHIASGSFNTNNFSGYLSHVAIFNGAALGSTRRAAYQTASGL